MPRASRFSQDDLSRMTALYLAGQNTKEIARVFSTDGGTVFYWLKKLGVPVRSISQAKRHYTLPEDAFAEVTDEATAYWFGFLCADGCVMQRRGCGEVHLVLAKRDSGHLERFAAFVGTDKPVRKEARYDTYRVALYSRLMSDNLIRLGCPPGKSLTLTFPVVTRDLEAHFVRGYFDDDGSVHKGGGLTEGGILTIVGTSAFLEGMRETIRVSTGATGALKQHCRSAAMYLRYGGQFQSWAVADWHYQGATVYLERKHAAIAAFPRGKRKGYPTAARYCGTAGNVSSETIRKYIEAQKGT